MVRIYLNEYGKKNVQKSVDVNIWSLVKANFLSGLIIAGISYGIVLILSLFTYLLFSIA